MYSKIFCAICHDFSDDCDVTVSNMGPREIKFAFSEVTYLTSNEWPYELWGQELSCSYHVIIPKLSIKDISEVQDFENSLQ